MKLLLASCILLLALGGAVQAQVSYPGLLTSEFDDPQTPLGMAPTLLQSRPEILPPPGAVWEGHDELTVHADKGRQGLLEDVHANGYKVGVRAALGPSPNTPQLVLSRFSLDTGLADNEGGKAFHLRGRFRQPEVRLLWPLRHGDLAYAGYQETEYEANGTTRLYDGLFTIFPQTPPFLYQGRKHLALAGLRVSLSLDWTAEAVAGQVSEPSRLTLHQDGNATQFTLPFGDSGRTVLLAIRRRLTPQSSLTAYLSGESLHGSGNVMREQERVIGSTDTTHREDGGGLEWQRAFGEHRTVGFFAEASRDRWQTRGFIPDPRALQTGYPFASDLSYGASYVIRKNAVGVRWRQATAAGREFQGNIQLVEASVFGDAHYAIRDFGLQKMGQTLYREDKLHFLLLRGSYRVPWQRFRLGLEASQLVPLGGGGSGRGGSAGGGGSGATSVDRRTTTGGWALTMRIERLF